MAVASPLSRLLPDVTRTERNILRDGWDRLQGVPGGKALFSRLIGKAAPYTSTIGARVEELRTGHAKVLMRDRPAVRNHLRCVHAIALANLAELTCSVACAYGLPDDARFIIAGLELDYRKKARGDITAHCDFPPIASSHREEYRIPVRMLDPTGEEVTHADVRVLVGPKQR